MTGPETQVLPDGTVIEIYGRIHEGHPYVPYEPAATADPFNLAKHADHDQSNHGNWARGGRSVNRDIAHRTLEEGGSTTSHNKAVKKGKALSVHPDRSRSYPNASRLNETAITAAIADYRNDNKDLLSGRGNAIGTWLDNETGTLWLDVITVVSTEGEADRLARAHNQIAYFDIDTGQEVRTGGTGIAKRWGDRVRGWFNSRGGDSAPAQDDGLGAGCIGCGDRSEPEVFDPLEVAKHADHDQSSHGNWARGGASNPVLTSNIDLAAEALGQGKHVQLGKYQQAAVLVDKLRDLVADAEAKGEKAPNYDLCKVTVKGTNLFCVENKGVPRAQMPQLKGVPTPGSKADELPRDPRGEVSLNDLFREHLVNKAVGVHNETVPAYWLKATQTELNGAKVAGIAKAYREGKLADERLFVSSDGYIIDGHHRWASILGVDLADGDAGDSEHLMDVAAIEMDVLDILAEANQFAADWGIPQAGFSAGFAKRLELLRLVRKHASHNQDDHGNWARRLDSSIADGPTYTPGGKVRPLSDNPHATQWENVPPDKQAQILENHAEVGLTPEQMERNLTVLMERVHAERPDLVEEGKTWYDQANHEITSIGERLGYDDGTAIGITAAMSPNSDWPQNLATAEHVMEIVKENPTIRLRPEDVEYLQGKAKGRTGEGARELLAADGKELSTLSDKGAAWAALVLGKQRDLRSNATTLAGEYVKVQWSTGTPMVEKAIAIARGGDPGVHLNGHKTRSFYNNISDPYNEGGFDDVTVDVHAVSATQAYRMPATSPRVAATFEGPQSIPTNQQGAYPLYAETFREVAEKFDVEPNQAQAMLWLEWQAVRSEYPGHSEDKASGTWIEQEMPAHVQGRWQVHLGGGETTR